MKKKWMLKRKMKMKAENGKWARKSLIFSRERYYMGGKIISLYDIGFGSKFYFFFFFYLFLLNFLYNVLYTVYMTLFSFCVHFRNIGIYWQSDSLDKFVNKMNYIFVVGIFILLRKIVWRKLYINTWKEFKVK